MKRAGGTNVPDELMMHADRQPHMRQHVLAVKADCKVMSGDYVESLATYTEAHGSQLYDWPVSLSLLLEVGGRHDDAVEHVRTEVSTDELYLHDLRVGRAVVTASEGQHDQALIHLRVAVDFAGVRPASLLGRDFLVTAAAPASLRGDIRRASQSLATERNSVWTRTQGPRVLSLHVRDRVRRIPTRNEVRNCNAQAASRTVDTALAAELGDAWPER